MEEKKPSLTDINSTIGSTEFFDKSDVEISNPNGVEHERLLADDIEVKLQKYFNDLVLEIKR